MINKTKKILIVLVAFMLVFTCVPDVHFGGCFVQASYASTSTDDDSITADSSNDNGDSTSENEQSDTDIFQERKALNPSIIVALIDSIIARFDRNDSENSGDNDSEENTVEIDDPMTPMSGLDNPAVLESLSQDEPLEKVSMPLWVTLLGVAVSGFLLTVVLEKRKAKKTNNKRA